MSDILHKAIAGEPITDADIESELYEICDRVHSSCDSDCPVYEKLRDVPWNDDLSKCKCFKNGKAMLAFLRQE